MYLLKNKYECLNNIEFVNRSGQIPTLYKTSNQKCTQSDIIKNDGIRNFEIPPFCRRVTTTTSLAILCPSFFMY